ncbi:MAG: 5-formyltetrahydrofolate cyclo-ligase [Gammaproteobacteria bacterium]|nr:5-formyltetrahydrofolate cyclo-ligase [Gammaproteobacteria bacterium]
MPASPRDQLRKSVRQQRRALSDHQQDLHAQSVAQQLSRHPLFLNASRIALYLAEDGEIDPAYLIHRAWKYKKQVYLPVLPPTGHALVFAPYHPGSRLITNRFGINEPNCHPSEWIRARQLNLILLPLVAFDEEMNRLGMGGGYYDRSLAFTRHRKQWHSPHLIGLAHECQKIEQLPCEPWDVPLNMIATERCLYDKKVIQE